MVDSCPDHGVLLTCREAGPNDEGQFALEGSDQKAKALDSFFSSRQKCSSRSTCVLDTVGLRATSIPVLYHDNEGTVYAFKSRLVVLMPAHLPGWHVPSPRSVHLLANHAFVVHLLGSVLATLLGVVVTLDTLRVEQVRITCAGA